MNTINQDLDDLDRMLAGSSPQDAIRSQVRLIAREVAALEADYSRLEEDHAKLKAALEHLNTENKRQVDDWLRKKADEHAKLIKRHSLNYGA